MRIHAILAVLLAGTTTAGVGEAQCAWSHQGLLTPAGGFGSEPQYFARGLSLSADELLVGSPGLDGATGVAQLYLRTSEGWEPNGILSSPATQPGDDFGRAVALDGDVAVIGAPLAALGAGRVVVFERTAGVWTEVATIAPPAGPAAAFGAALAVHGDTLLVGAPLVDSVFTFERAPAGWTASAVLKPDEHATSFGAALAFDGAHAVVGAPDEEEAFVFDAAPGGWIETISLEAEDELVEARFGVSVALSGDLIAIGAEGEQEDDEPAGAGAVYVFRHAGSWQQEATIAAPSGAAGVRFGASVALDGDVLAVGSPGDQGGLGRVFAFYGYGSHWFEAAALEPYLTATQGQFGSAVVLEGDELLANIGLDETGLIGAVGPYAGAAQAWTSPGPGCDPLLADAHAISVSLGGSQALLLGLGEQDHAPLYLVLGSASGSYPGSVLGAAALPLNLDTYSGWTASHANSGPLQATFGALPQGAPTIASLNVPAGASGLVGLTLHHAFVEIDPGHPSFFVGASNAVELQLLP